MAVITWKYANLRNDHRRNAWFFIHEAWQPDPSSEPFPEQPFRPRLWKTDVGIPIFQTIFERFILTHCCSMARHALKDHMWRCFCWVAYEFPGSFVAHPNHPANRSDVWHNLVMQWLGLTFICVYRKRNVVFLRGSSKIYPVHLFLQRIDHFCCLCNAAPSLNLFDFPWFSKDVPPKSGTVTRACLTASGKKKSGPREAAAETNKTCISPTQLAFADWHNLAMCFWCPARWF